MKRISFARVSTAAWGKIKRFEHVLLLLSLVLASSCINISHKTSGSSIEGTARSASDAPSDQREIVIAYFGGFNSCGSAENPSGLYAWDRFQQLRAAYARSGTLVHFVASCYYGTTSDTILWQSSRLSEYYAVPWDHPNASGQVFDEVTRLTKMFKLPLFIIGHSYGGWLATNFAAQAFARYGAEDGSKIIQGLFTIDPISPYHCGQASYASTVLQWASPGATLARMITGEGPCEQAPPQITHADDRLYPGDVPNIIAGRIQNYVKRGTKVWVNFYQDRDFLHSSAIESLDGMPINRRVVYTNVPMPGFNSAPHVAIHRDAEVWSTIVSKINEARSAGFSR